MFLDGFGPQILAGTLVTLKLALGSLLGAVLIGLLGASAKLAANRPLRALASGYTTLIRSVPDLVIMLLLFFSLQILLNRVTDALGIGQVDIDPFAAGCVTLAFIYGAYFTETFRGAFQAVPAGQVEAAQAYGMGRWRVFRRVLLPQMLRYALPSADTELSSSSLRSARLRRCSTSQLPSTRQGRRANQESPPGSAEA